MQKTNFSFPFFSIKLLDISFPAKKAQFVTVIPIVQKFNESEAAASHSLQIALVANWRLRPRTRYKLEATASCSRETDFKKAKT
jgi:hypothetical protein